MNSIQAMTPWLIAIAPALARMLAVVFTLPVTSSVHVPVRFRIGLAVVTTLAIAPAVIGSDSTAIESAGLATLPAFLIVIFHEILLGATMGLAAQIVLAGARVTGSVVESLSGMSFMKPDVPDADQPGGQVISRLFWWTTLAVFIAAGGVNEVMGGVIHSFHLLPPGSAGTEIGLPGMLAMALTNGFEFGLRAVLPGLLALLVASVILGMARQNCPQLGGMQVGLGFQSLAGLVVTSLLLLSTPWIINGGLEETISQMQQMLVAQPGSAVH